jgi:hypothetical protein
MRRWTFALLSLLPAATPALAQNRVVELTAEAATDERRRGLSWTDGKAAASAQVTAQLPLTGLDASARVTTLRGADRHGGADAVVDLEGGYGFDLGLVRLEARGIGHVFTGGTDDLNYGELGLGGGVLFGPLQVDLFGRYAPPQDAIGGDNLYLGARASAGIPTTAFTVRAGVGRSSGSVDDPVRAARLRPDGGYTDWMLGVTRVSGGLSLSLDYTGTDVERFATPSPFAELRHAGDRLTARAAIRF